MCESRRCPGPPTPKVLVEIWRIVLDVFGYPSWLLYSSELSCSAHIFKSPVSGSFLSSRGTPPTLPSYDPFSFSFSFHLTSSRIGLEGERARCSALALRPISSPMIKDGKTFVSLGGGGCWRLGRGLPLRCF